MNKGRLLIVVFLMFAGFAIIVARLVDIQIVNYDELKSQAKRQHTAIEIIKAPRGLIYDRNKNLLVYNQNDISFYVDLKVANEKQRQNIAKIFSETFNKPIQHYLNLMDSKKRIVCIEKKVSGSQIIELKNLKINGLYYEDDPTRVYQYGQFASHILGYVNTEFIGTNGVERTFNEILSGEDGRRKILRDALGNMITVVDGTIEETIPGDNIVLTIDKNLQQILENTLRESLTKTKSNYAIGILMNPNTGEILALSNIEDYDPNHYNLYSDTLLRNKAVTDLLEPGSTFKVFTIASLLEKKLCREDEKVFAENGSYKFNGRLIRDTEKNGYITVKEVLTHSSNIGIAKLSQRIDNETFYKNLRGFGFGNYTNIKLPGEVKGNLKTPDKWSKQTKASISFGYEILVTPIQLLTAFASVINGGILFEPAIIKKVTDYEAQTSYDFQPKIVRHTISEETSNRMRELLIDVVENGTGKKAKIDNIKIGGKTGTSKKLVDGKYSNKFYNSSFIGFFPADNPQYCMLIILDAPIIGSYYAGETVAPIFKKVVEQILELNFIEKDFKNNKKKEFESKDNLEVKFANENKNEELKIEKTVQQKELISNSNYKKNENVFSNNKIKNTMPNLVGLSLREAVRILTDLKINFSIDGNGKIVNQSIEPGTLIQPKMNCKLIAKIE